jgi:mitochondrial enoyl-[acyl-carrier protein] reductase / trans-2-enoyl-CoA reductase
MLFAPINPSDINVVVGTYGSSPKLPAFGGNEGVGIIEEVGPEVKNLKVGDKVIMAKQFMGTWRQHLVEEESCFDQINAKIPDEYASILNVNLSSAYRMIHDFVSLKPGDVILQNGGNSVVGQSVIQIAKSMGLKTISIIRARPDQHEIVERLKMVGGDIVVTEDYASKSSMFRLISDLPKPKLALNCVGGDSIRTLSKILEYFLFFNHH